jgi:CheY-like chemotaxis protein
MTGSGPANGARVLVVDDDDTIRLVLAKHLRTRGFEVATAESGDAALATPADSRLDSCSATFGCRVYPAWRSFPLRSKPIPITASRRSVLWSSVARA